MVDRFGYSISEVEVIMFRRRDEQQRWGRVDYSKSIKLSAPAGELNGLMVLWSFHVKYAVLNQEEGWELPSFFHNMDTPVAAPHRKKLNRVTVPPGAKT